MNNEEEIDLKIKEMYLSIIKGNILRLYIHCLEKKDRKTANVIMETPNNLIDRYMNKDMDFLFNKTMLDHNKMMIEGIIKEYSDIKKYLDKNKLTNSII